MKITSNYELFQHILCGSIEYSICAGILTLRSYRTGQAVKIDLSMIDEDTFNEIEASDDEEEEWEDE